MLHDKIWFFSCFAPNQGQNEIQGFFFSPIETIENLPNDNINCWELQSGEIYPFDETWFDFGG